MAEKSGPGKLIAWFCISVAKWNYTKAATFSMQNCQLFPNQIFLGMVPGGGAIAFLHFYLLATLSEGERLLSENFCIYTLKTIF